MKRLLKLFVLLVTISTITGCGVGRYFESKASPQNGCLIVGYLDTTKAACDLQWMNFQPLAAQANKNHFAFRTDKGTFYKESVPLGNYELADFGGAGTRFWDKLNGIHFKFKFPSPNIHFRVDQPGRIYFVGSYQVTTKSDASGESTKIEAVDDPRELEVLKMILPAAKGSAWEADIQERIKQLSSHHS